MSLIDSVAREAGYDTLTVIRRLQRRIELLETQLATLMRNNQITNRVVNGVVFYQQDTEPPVPQGPGRWENTLSNPSVHYLAHTNSSGTRVWRQDN